MWITMNQTELKETTNFDEEDNSYIANNEGENEYYIDNVILNENVKQKYHQLYGKLLYGEVNNTNKNSLACLDCMKSFLIQAIRVIIQYNEILKRIKNNNNWDQVQIKPLFIQDSTLLAVNSIDIMTDYESMLYHARATLDRMTFFICKQIYNQNKDSFDDKIFSVLKNFEKRDVVIEALQILENSFKSFQGILVDFEKKEGESQAKTGLRSLFAHSKSHDEATKGNFSFTFFPNNEFLVFDQQLVENVTLLESTYKLLINIPYTVINLISIVSQNEERLSLDDCKILWNRNWIVIEDFDFGEDRQIFNYLKLDGKSATIQQANLNKEVLQFKQKIL